MRARLVQIGNSRGLRLAKPLLEEAGLTDEVEIRAQAGALVITAVQSPRAGWAEAAATFGPAKLIDAPSNTRFDDEEWTW
jgi:antitoxin MazE